MGTVLLDISMSLDGFIATPNDDVERLHRWAVGHWEGVLEMFQATNSGAVITGRRTFDLADGWGGRTPFPVPYFIVSHNVPDRVASGEWPAFTVVTTGLEDTIAQAKKVAGDRTVYIMGGADIAQQSLRSGLLDEIQLHVIPVLFGTGIRLFDNIGDEHVELEAVSAIEFEGMTRLRYRVVK